MDRDQVRALSEAIGLNVPDTDLEEIGEQLSSFLRRLEAVEAFITEEEPVSLLTAEAIPE